MIRQLRPGERVPDSDPRRYVTGHGYIRLRWKVGPREYVETYEHRVVDGVVTDAEHVHHFDHVKNNNDPQNLRLLTAEEHQRIHHRRGSIPLWEARQLYEKGWSPARLGERYGIAGWTVHRYLRDAGVPMRGHHASNRVELDADRVRSLHAAGVRAEGIARELGLRSAEPVRRAFLELGLQPFSSGRPPTGVGE